MQPWEFKKKLKEVLDTVPESEWVVRNSFSLGGGCLMQRVLGFHGHDNVGTLGFLCGIDTVCAYNLASASDSKNRGKALEIWNSLPDGPPEPVEAPDTMPELEPVLVAVR